MFFLTVLSGRPSKISTRWLNDRFDLGFDSVHTKDKRKNLISWLNQEIARRNKGSKDDRISSEREMS